jgi:acyl carrier protein
MSLLNRVQETVATTLDVPVKEIKADTVNTDVAAWDSVGHVNLMMAIEQTFDIQLEVEDFATLNSVPAIVEYLNRQNIE